jgi:2-C-methyl-D-erythritol 4-phosphate cytidylyltransferase
VDRIVVVVPEEDLQLAGQTLLGTRKELVITRGGATRQESVRNGLICSSGSSRVLIHDGVRPLISPGLIDRVIRGLSGVDGCIPALKVSDTLKEGSEGMVVRTIPRSNAYQIQTPQAFVTELLVKAHERAARKGALDFTDDSALVEEAGGRVRIVEGDPLNVKITLQEDLILAEAILRCRTGSA